MPSNTAPASANILTPDLVDISGCRGMEGVLDKQNSKGVWKARYCKLINSTFLGYKTKSGKPTSEVKENFDLTKIFHMDVVQGALIIKLSSGEQYSFKGNYVDLWEDSILKRKDWASEQNTNTKLDHTSKNTDVITTNASASPNTPSSNTPASNTPATNPIPSTDRKPRTLSDVDVHSIVHIAGYLLKKSHNKYQGYQERYLKLEGYLLKYFKRKEDDKELGYADLNTAEFVRPYDSTSSCTIFEVHDGDRVFLFQAPSHSEMNRWTTIIESVRVQCQTKQRLDLEAKIQSEKPFRIRIFDEDGEAAFLQEIKQNLNELYPGDDDDGDHRVNSIEEHLQCASEVVKYLQEFIPETAKTSYCPSTRSDILATMLIQVNQFLTHRMQPILMKNYLSTMNEGEMRSSAGASVSDNVDGSGVGDEMGRDRLSSSPMKEGVQRHPLLEQATLGELHQLIDWITKYQTKLRSISCPTMKLPDHLKQPKNCGLFDCIPDLCALYVYGGSLGAKGGAAAHLFDHCNKVWEGVLRNPEEMLQRRHNGSFYTEAPIGMWEAINQHIALATSTQSPILHVMIADKVVSSLNKVISIITDFVVSLDNTDNQSKLKEVELEFVCALANDTALHIEEVVELIENFEIAEIRERIDEIFDSLTTNLVECGQTCLKRLANLVMKDTKNLLDEVFTEDWLEGHQMHVATATISDYMTDFEEFLVSFWAEKFVYTILEEVIIRYTRSIVFKTGGMRKRKSSDNASNNFNNGNQSNSEVGSGKKGFFTTIFRGSRRISGLDSPATSALASSPSSASAGSVSSKNVSSTLISQISQIAIGSSGGLTLCDINEESLGRLAQDVNTLNAFFSQKAGQEVATEFLALINEVSLLLVLDVDEVVVHVISRISEYPSAALAIFITAKYCLKMREEKDINKQDIQYYENQLRPALQCAPTAFKENEANGIAEGRLGLLYADLVPKDIIAKSGLNDSVSGLGGMVMTIAQKLKIMSMIPLLSTEVVKPAEEDDDEEEEDEAEPSSSSSTKIGIVGEVMDVLNQQQVMEAEWIRAEEEAQLNEEELRNAIGMLAYDGYLEKKSAAAHNLWQRRWFKLTTREAIPSASTEPNAKPFIYNFMWFKKEGGSVIKAVEVDKIASISIIVTPRPMVFVIKTDRQPRGSSTATNKKPSIHRTYNLMLKSEAELLQNTERMAYTVIPVAFDPKFKDSSFPTTSVTSLAATDNSTYFYYSIDLAGEKEHILRTTKVDRIVKWINVLSLAAGLAYDEGSRKWNRSALIRLKDEQFKSDQHHAEYYRTKRSNSTREDRKDSFSTAVLPPMMRSHSDSFAFQRDVPSSDDRDDLSSRSSLSALPAVTTTGGLLIPNEILLVDKSNHSIEEEKEIDLKELLRDIEKKKAELMQQEERLKIQQVALAKEREEWKKERELWEAERLKWQSERKQSLDLTTAEGGSELTIQTNPSPGVALSHGKKPVSSPQSIPSSSPSTAAAATTPPPLSPFMSRMKSFRVNLTGMTSNQSTASEHKPSERDLYELYQDPSMEVGPTPNPHTGSSPTKRKSSTDLTTLSTDKPQTLDSTKEVEVNPTQLTVATQDSLVMTQSSDGAERLHTNGSNSITTTSSLFIELEDSPHYDAMRSEQSSPMPSKVMSPVDGTTSSTPSRSQSGLPPSKSPFKEDSRLVAKYMKSRAFVNRPSLSDMKSSEDTNGEDDEGSTVRGSLTDRDSIVIINDVNELDVGGGGSDPTTSKSVADSGKGSNAKATLEYLRQKRSQTKAASILLPATTGDLDGKASAGSSLIIDTTDGKELGVDNMSGGSLTPPGSGANTPQKRFIGNRYNRSRMLQKQRSSSKGMDDGELGVDSNDDAVVNRISESSTTPKSRSVASMSTLVSLPVSASGNVTNNPVVMATAPPPIISTPTAKRKPPPPPPTPPK